MIGLIDRNTKKASLQRRSSDVEENDLQEEDNEKLHRNGNLAGNLFRVILILAFLAWLTTFTAPNVSYVADQKQSSIKFLKTADSFVTATESSIPVHGAALPATQSTTAYSVQCIDHLPQPDLRLHMVEPPAGAVTLVCCNSTKGVLNIEVHPTWAPKGAERFLYMVKNNFFSTKVGLFRALKGFLVQFGLAGDPEVHKFYHQLGNLPDDPSWLPLGPSGRVVNGVERFRKGYLAYAGAGKNSRGTQLIMAFNNNRYLGGGSPWEVPFGQLVGEESFITLSKIYTGYNEKPSQGKIMNRGVQYLEEEFPLLDYITECHISKENVPWHYFNASKFNKLDIDSINRQSYKI